MVKNIITNILNMFLNIQPTLKSYIEIKFGKHVLPSTLKKNPFLNLHV